MTTRLSPQEQIVNKSGENKYYMGFDKRYKYRRHKNYKQHRYISPSTQRLQDNGLCRHLQQLRQQRRPANLYSQPVLPCKRWQTDCRIATNIYMGIFRILYRSLSRWRGYKSNMHTTHRKRRLIDKNDS